MKNRDRSFFEMWGINLFSNPKFSGCYKLEDSLFFDTFTAYGYQIAEKSMKFIWYWSLLFIKKLIKIRQNNRMWFESFFCNCTINLIKHYSMSHKKYIRYRSNGRNWMYLVWICNGDRKLDRFNGDGELKFLTDHRKAPCKQNRQNLTQTIF